MVKTPCFHCRGLSAVQKKKKKIKKKTKIEAERSIKGFKKALFVESKEKGNIC